MTLISSSVPNLMNGVSQQPEVLRLSSQGQAQTNGLSSVAEGLLKRPPSSYLGKFAGITNNAFFHTINRDSQERYHVAIENGDLKVVDLDGNPITVSFPDGKDYLTTANPKDTFQCVTVADYTFILNKTKVVTANTTLSTKRTPEALIWIKQGAYGSTYRVVVDGLQVASYTVPDGSVASHSTSVTSTNIATQLVSQMVTAIGTNFSISRYGSTIRVARLDNNDFTISGDSPNGDAFMDVIKGSVQRFSDLPARAVNGFAVEVAGDNASEFDNYYVRYDTTGTGSNNGVWKETVKGGEKFSLNQTTMPHALIRQANGTFAFQAVDFNSRSVGDSDSAPMPSFVGRAIADVFFFRNRLGFAADENIIFSRAGDFFNFFRSTATAVLDDDPIDVGVSHVKVSLIRQAVPFNESLLLFSDQTQFQTGAANVLTPETISINPTTEYECSLRARPVGVGKYVYFATNHGKFSGIREYYVDKDTESEQAADITAHVPKYIKGQIRHMAASSSEDMLAVLTDEDPRSLYVYKYYFSGEEKLQASWSHWNLGGEGDILSCSFIESNLYLMVGRSDGVHIEVIDMSADVIEDGWKLRVHLDSKLTESEITRQLRPDTPSPTGIIPTEVILPYRVSDTEAQLHLVTGPAGQLPEGTLLKPTSVSNTATTTSLFFDRDLMTQEFIVGRPYEFRYRLSKLMVRESQRSGGQVTITQGRLQLRKATLTVSKTGYLRVEVTPFNRQTYSYVFTGNTLGGLSNLLGVISLNDGLLSFPIMSKNDTVDIEFVNDSFLSSALLGLDWEGLYTTRSRRI